MKRERDGADFSAEVEAHIRLEADRYRARGMSEEEALAAARRAFGNVTRTEERFYESRRWLWWDSVRQDTRIGLRLLKSTPGWTMVAALTVALGIGATAAMFSIVNTVLLRPLPFPRASQLYAIEELGKFGSMAHAPEYFTMRESLGKDSAFQEMGAFDTSGVNWTSGDRAERLVAGTVTTSFFSTLEAQALHGRTFLPEEEKRGASAAVILSYALWKRGFGGDPAIIGQTIRLNRNAVPVIGVMPPEFDYPRGSDLWVPLALDQERLAPRRIIELVARARPASTRAQVDQELARLSGLVIDNYPACCRDPDFLKNLRIAAEPLQQQLTGNMRPALLMFSGAVGLMLLIVCFTVANLMLARATAHRREIAVRVALGSPRRRIASQLIVESLLVSLLGGAIGIGLAVVSVDALNGIRGTALAGLPEIAVDFSTLAFAFAVTVLTGVAFGLVPALGSFGFGVREALQGESRNISSSAGLRRMRQSLVVAQLGLSLTLAIGAGLLAKSFYKLRTMDPGFNSANVLTARVNLTGPSYQTAQRQHEFMENLIEKVSRLPGVERASVGPIPPGTAGNFGIFSIENRPDAPLNQRPVCARMDVSVDYFRTLGVPVLQGRGLLASDSAAAPLVVVINQAFARKFLPGENPLGQHINGMGPSDPDWAEIVGVVGDIRQSGLDQEVTPTVYRTIEQQGAPFLTRTDLLIHTANNAGALIPALEKVVAGIDRDQPVFNVKLLDRRLADSLGSRRFDAAVTGAFALMAVFLASIGVYGVMSYLVTLRTAEIGIRLALGAQRRQVVGLVLREGVLLAGIGGVLGVGGALGLGRYLATLLYGVSTRDFATFVVAAVALVAAVLLACYLPGRRAARVDAAVALRHI